MVHLDEWLIGGIWEIFSWDAKGLGSQRYLGVGPFLPPFLLFLPLLSEPCFFGPK